jgi:hypothetical protein
MGKVNDKWLGSFIKISFYSRVDVLGSSESKCYFSDKINKLIIIKINASIYFIPFSVVININTELFISYYFTKT